MFFGKALHLILMHFYILYSMLWGKFSKIRFIFPKKLFFKNFDWSKLIFNPSKFCFKNSMSLCLVRLIEPVFRSIKYHVSGFLKIVLWLFQTSFSKVFQLFLSLSLSDLARLHSNFLSFSSLIFARFSSLKVDMTILSLLYV